MCQRADKRVLPGGQDGFTLVEVLIVVAILALVAAGLVGLSSYLQTQNNIVLTEKCVDLLSTAVAEFYDITGHYPIDDWSVRDDSIISPGCRIAGAELTSGSLDDASDELLYLQLSLLPQTRAIIAKLPEKLLAAPGGAVQLAGQSSNTRYLRSIVDAWGNALVYEEVSGGFPIIRSYGPDGPTGGTEDDISNED